MIKVEGVEYNVTATPCERRTLIEPCPMEYYCVDDGNTAQCVRTISPASYDFTLTFDINVAASAVNQSTPEYAALKDSLETQVWRLLRGIVGFESVTVTGMR